VASLPVPSAGVKKDGLKRPDCPLIQVASESLKQAILTVRVPIGQPPIPVPGAKTNGQKPPALPLTSLVSDPRKLSTLTVRVRTLSPNAPEAWAENDYSLPTYGPSLG